MSEITTDILITNILNGMHKTLDDEQLKQLKDILYIQLHDIENMLCKELEDVKRKGEISSNSMEVISKSLDGIKDIYTIEAMKESGYSNAYEYSGMHMPWYSYDGMNGNSYRGYDGNTYDGRGRGRYADRDSQGRYSSEGYSRNSEEEIRRLMEKAGDPHEREILKRALDDMRNK